MGTAGSKATRLEKCEREGKPGGMAVGAGSQRAPRIFVSCLSRFGFGYTQGAVNLEHPRDLSQPCATWIWNAKESSRLEMIVSYLPVVKITMIGDERPPFRLWLVLPVQVHFFYPNAGLSAPGPCPSHLPGLVALVPSLNPSSLCLSC